MAKRRSIFFVADIHGSEVCWRKFLNAAKFYGVDTIVVGGDVTGKALVPVVERRDGTVEARVAGRVQSARSEAEVAEFPPLRGLRRLSAPSAVWLILSSRLTALCWSRSPS